ncbi:MAG: toprim domain-containing protein [Chloroflexi bacterium]|nr:toprim domain-containing protein [Chloroflexota bacterium]
MQARIDTAALKRDRPIAEVVAGYGVELRPSGRALLGRCPFHADGGRPNFHVYPATASFYCFRCRVGGDAIGFVERIEGVDFRGAVARLLEAAPPIGRARWMSSPPRRRPTRRARRGPEDRACLAAAVELYHNRLLTDPDALAYLAGRGLERAILECCRVGYAAGDELAAYLRWRGVSPRAALRLGLLGRGGRELMAGRVVVPEIRAGQVVWLVGRTIRPDATAPKYLALPGPKPLLGWEPAARERTVCLVEGVFDWLTLRQWAVPALALVGTHARPAAIEALRRFDRVYLALDGDEPGRQAAAELQRALGPAAVTVSLGDVKDVGELATRPDGPRRFARAVLEAALGRMAPATAA